MTEKDIKDKGKMEHATGEGNFLRCPSGNLIVGLHTGKKPYLHSSIQQWWNRFCQFLWTSYLTFKLPKMEWFTNITQKSSWKKLRRPLHESKSRPSARYFSALKFVFARMKPLLVDTKTWMKNKNVSTIYLY